eukprot:TRINITY_DN103449_c0_g1_i1.p1 TRINITY_DN103449_c0_g1~~TRINITY_DN103449_c0_g1_i1.p1  ORF type:complete len:1094 (-),score=412.40 TRINITY_DN103449_c0_g1_i1:73-3354(-)
MTAAAATPFDLSNSQQEEKRSDKYNVKQYRGLADTVSSIQKTVDRQRTEAAAERERLNALLEKQQAESQQKNKELSVKLRVAGRSYDQLLTATRELSDQIRAEQAKRLAEVEPLQAEIKDLKAKLSVIEKPWKDEVAKRDLKILKLQEMIPPLEQKIREEKVKLPPVIAKFKQELKMREDATEAVLKEIAFIERQHADQLKQAAVELATEKQRAAEEIKPVRDELEEVKAVLATATDPFKKQIKELEKKSQRLQKELDKVDYSPYQKEVELKELGFQKLVRDFEVKENYNLEQQKKMRESFETVICKMDKKMADLIRNQEARLAPYKEAIEQKEHEVEVLERKLEEFKSQEAETRKREKEERNDIMKELSAAREAIEISSKELTKAKRALANQLEELESDNGPLKQMKRLEMKLEDVTQKCQTLTKQRDRELIEKNDIITSLQQRLADTANSLQDLDGDWNKRVIAKEDGYQRVIAELAYAEGQIEEERLKTQEKVRELKLREKDIARLKEEHTEELKFRLEDRESLEKFIRQIEVEHLGQTVQFEEHIKDREAEVLHFRKRWEADVTDLRIDISRRDRAHAILEGELKVVRQEYDKSRMAWEDKERELEMFVRNRDRHVTALRNEIEFINDSWEIKYNNLLNVFEKLQKKYDQAIGPNGLLESQRRVRDLKDEIVFLNSAIEDLKEQIKKQKRRIRDLELDIDGVMKETADILAEKERGIAEMVKDYSKLQNKYREQQELMQQVIKEKDAEQVAIVESFQDRIDALEQLAESMRFTERQELLDKISTWKRAYERIVLERDDIEETLTERVQLRDEQVIKMAEENNEIRDRAIRQHELMKEDLVELDTQWQKKEIMWGSEKDELLRRIKEMEDQARRIAACNNVEERKAALMAKHSSDDGEKDRLRAQIAQKDIEMEQVQAGIAVIVEENRQLSVVTEQVSVDTDAIHDSYKPIIAEKDRMIKKMEREHEELKQILEIEMYKAQEACLAIQERVKKFPNPFEIEVREMRDKYAQMQAGMQKMSLENIKLREDFIDVTQVKDAEIKDLEANLALAARFLKEIAELDIVQEASAGKMLRAQINSFNNRVNANLAR